VLPTSITLRNYRSFAGPVRLELRPITLLFGDNNAGKSALLRALPILSDSTGARASGPLELESPAARGSSFQDLRWKGLEEDEDRDVVVGLCWNGAEGVAQVEYSLTWAEREDWQRLVIRRLVVKDRAGGILFEAVWTPSRAERAAGELLYEILSSSGVKPLQGRLGFQGLVPRAGIAGLETLKDRLDGLRDQVQWLTATRQLPERILPLPSAPRWRMRQDGGDAPSVLAGSSDFLTEVSSWYEQHLQRRLHVQQVPPDRFRLMMQHLEKGVLDTDLADNGEGTIQVLPVLTALALTRRQDQGGPGILAVEEPESHLHPSLQRALAERICEVAASSPSSRIVIETHSEHLLLGVQLQVVRGLLRPEDVQVYWVHQLDGGQSVAEPVTLDREARFQGQWPPGVFAEDTEVAREIIRTRRERAQP
jgi:predicted ATPase